MVTVKLRKHGNSYIVTVPRREVERLGLQEGDLVAIELSQPEVSADLPPDLREAFEASWQANEAGYRYLAER